MELYSAVGDGQIPCLHSRGCSPGLSIVLLQCTSGMSTGRIHMPDLYYQQCRTVIPFLQVAKPGGVSLIPKRHVDACKRGSTLAAA